jgi:hypothetical protein
MENRSQTCEEWLLDNSIMDAEGHTGSQLVQSTYSNNAM